MLLSVAPGMSAPFMISTGMPFNCRLDFGRLYLGNLGVVQTQTLSIEHCACTLTGTQMTTR